MYLKKSYKIIGLSICILSLNFLCTNCYLDNSIANLSSKTVNHDINYSNSQVSDPCTTPGHFCYEEAQRISQAIDNICASGGNSETDSNFDLSTFSWDKVHYLNGGVIYNHNVSEWSETSRITNFEMTKNGFCMNHTKRSSWSETFTHYFYSEEWTTQGEQHIIIPHDGNFYFKTVDFLNLPNSSSKLLPDEISSMCGNHTRFHNNGTIKGALKYMIGSMRKIWLGGSAQRNAVAPIQDWYPKPGDTLGFVLSTPTNDRENSKLKEKSDIVWIRIPNYCSVSSGGEIVDRTSDSGSSRTTQTQTQTQTSTTYNTNHYKQAGQEYLPSCGEAARLAGHGGYGSDGQEGTSDDLHVYTSHANSCDTLNAFGQDHWKNFTWTDPLTLKTRDNSQIYEVVKNGGVCCVRDN